MSRSRTKALNASDAALQAKEIEDGREWGRKAILAGWILAMAGVVGYCFAMLRAPQDAGLLDALFSQGFIGWISAVLLLGGVATWFVGNLAFFRQVLETPGKDGNSDAL
jgi:hypothetical protein